VALGVPVSRIESGIESALLQGAGSALLDDGLPVGHRVVGSPDDHEVRPGDAFVLAIGIPSVRRAVAEGLQSRGASFLSLIHDTAMVAASATIGEGAIICP